MIGEKYIVQPVHAQQVPDLGLPLSLHLVCQRSDVLQFNKSGRSRIFLAVDHSFNKICEK